MSQDTVAIGKNAYSDTFTATPREYLFVGYLSDSDLRRFALFTTTLEQITRPDSELDELHVLVLEAMRALLPCDVLSYNKIVTGGPNTILIQPDDVMGPVEQEIFEALLPTHPIINHIRATGDTTAIRFSDVIRSAELARNPLYTEFFCRLGLHYQLAFSTDFGDGIVVGIAANRCGSDFSDTDRVLADLARGQLVHVHRAADLRAKLEAVPDNSHSRARLGLTPREHQVLELVADGCTNMTIARRLDISRRTVDKHLDHIRAKLAVPNRTAAALAAFPTRIRESE
ncbi:helix-turn-helix transcriptional regulator [Nocardia arthritidis]|uniref:HTH luxR-type domain-containing protein n=1 Tax=Nocardia arthritidis TaxID=228602 RepID=A0A6G9YMG3_9NOCA|nr:helix-turn-helix transcriptional regulator [Nocardia arthritidis]QIS14226.1 hypothetical protein F5544_31935 [Nocardia arthritidis]